MAFTFIEDSETDGTTNTVPSVLLSSDSVGDLIVMVLAETQNNVAAITLPTGYIPRVSENDGTGCLIIADKVCAVNGENIVLGGRSGSGNYEMVGLVFRGQAASGYFDQATHTNYGSVAAATPGSITPSNTTELLVAAAKHVNTSGGEGADSGFTLKQVVNLTRLVVGYKIKTDAAAENPSLSWNTASDAYAAMVAYSTTTIGGTSRPDRHLPRGVARGVTRGVS